MAGLYAARPQRLRAQAAARRRGSSQGGFPIGGSAPRGDGDGVARRRLIGRSAPQEDGGRGMGADVK
ncbi:hypothetical protein chiPu_0022602 [Chiloscyllium punctatum]|uniref:Uncharacterized protein n=1 Tax=Chiloscyllium punctatum TaxID=137246 RepID=A0A401RFB1_CHIPU|nr:hypothetical protein [Chiloscyllium punctatum]